ncbi:hypothetical protein COUCH_15415 [Couchioplanes caeruleus]|uniref:hypothetical protein n=1 Tax=Couchioplanes caeruleus TaxID=56438 RepID=UPI0020C15117|nr:hypothetical protein [Couchioplanes caeruleus]UQU67571.1 hypothetical protein COUCH_15415 [Couchioplanes caeruleus]
MSARAAMLLAAPFALLAFAMHVGATLWLQPLTWRIDSFAFGLLAYFGLAVTSFGIPLAAYLLLTKTARQRPPTWHLDELKRRFVAGASPCSTGPLAILFGWFTGGAILTERVPNEEHMRIAQFGVMTTISIVLAVGLLTAIVVRLLMNRPRISLTVEGITVQRLRGCGQTRWDELLPGGPPPPAKRNPNTLILYTMNAAAGGPPQPRALPVRDLHVDTAFLANTIRCYVENPDRRAAIGTAGERARLHLLLAGRADS